MLFLSRDPIQIAFKKALVCACFVSALAGVSFTTYAQPKQATDSAANTASAVTATVVDALDVLVDRLSQTTLNTANTVLDRAQLVVGNALDLIGVRYRFGGNTPEEGLDCSGFVKLVFQKSMGVLLPRRAVEMSQKGESVSPDALQPGDLVFYNTLRQPNSHVGIYIGDGQFVHAPSSGGKVRTESMNTAYWLKRYNGARRVTDSN